MYVKIVRENITIYKINNFQNHRGENEYKEHIFRRKSTEKNRVQSKMAKINRNGDNF